MLNVTLNHYETVEESSARQPFAIEVRDLHKTYPGKKAVDGVSFGVLKGEIFGILGPNGAGKSTTLEIIEGLRNPDQHGTSQVQVDGLDVLKPAQRDEIKQRIGLQLQTSSLFEELTVRENLEMLAMLYRKARPVKELLKEFDLEEKAGMRLDTLSGGQKQRVALAAALVNNPAILFLDEPTTALDPQARRNVWDIIRKVRESGKTIILTTHYMEEAETICDRVAIMDNGRLVALGTPAQLIRQHAAEPSIMCRFDIQNGPALSLEEMERLPGVRRVIPNSGDYVLNTGDLGNSLAALVEAARVRKAVLAELSMHSPGLEDVFINLTGRHLRD